MKPFLCSLLLSVLILFSAQAQAQMTSGTVTNGTVAKPPNTSTQTFTGTAGEGIILYGYDATFNNLTIAVKRPDGTSWGSSSNRFSGTLSQTGTYTVTLSVPVGAANGSYAYSLYYVRGGSSVCCGSLTSGVTTTDTLATNELKSYQFSGTAGQYMFLNGASSTFTTSLTIYKPDGSLWQSNLSTLVGALPATGTYTVVVSGQFFSSTGSFNLYYLRGADSVSDGTLNGQPYYTSLEKGQIRSWTFTGTPGKALLVRTGTSYTTTVWVLKPDGSLSTWNNNGLTITLPVTSSSPYTLVVNASAFTNTGPLDLYSAVGGTEEVSNGTLQSGLVRDDGNLPPNGLDSYIFTGTSGHNLTISSTGSYTRKIHIIRPNGTALAVQDNSTSFTLDATGTYMLGLYGPNTVSTGPYTLTLTSTPIPPPTTTASKSPMPAQGRKGCPVRPTAENIKLIGMSSGTGQGGVSGGGDGGGGGTSIAINGPVAAVGNPINFDVGYKEQVETDYDAGGLSFTRIYRSDSTWTDNTVGTFWRHNYARKLNVSGSNADIADGSGARIYFTLTGGNWVPDDPSTRSKLVTSGSDYLYTLPDGTVEKYNSSRLLTRIAYLGGGALNLTYNGSNELTGVTNENGRSLTLTYSSGKVATVVTPDGTFSYSYTSNNLTTVTRPDTKTTVYHYENGTYPNALTGITDAKGNRYSTYAYSGGSGKASSTKLAGNVDEYTVAYNTNDSTVTNPLTKNTSYYYRNIQGVRRITQAAGAASTNCPASNRYYGYDTLGRVVFTTDWENNVTRYAYDSRSNVIRIAEAAGTGIRRMTYITWDPTFNLPNVVTEPGLTTDFDYDTYGRLVTMTETDTATAATRITTYAYHSNGTDGSGNTILGRLAQIDGPRTDVSDITSFAYDGNYNLTTVTNALSQVTTITARDAAGRPTTVQDPNGINTVITYDSNGWLNTATRASGTGLAALYDFDYDFNGNLTKVTLPNGVFVEYSYDNAQRLTGIKDSLNNTVTYTLNNAGNATQVEVKNATPTQTYVHSQTFDELMRLLTSVGAATPAQTATFAYDKNSNLKTYTDPKTNATNYSYDALQRLSTATNALSGVTTLGYTGLDDINSVKDQRNNTTTYTYNAFGDVIGETSPDRGTLSYVVDKAGNVTQRTDARSVVTNFTYDALNRPLTVAYPSDTSLNVTLTYDTSSGCGTAYRGRLCTVVDATGTTTYVYDVLGRVTSVSENRGGGLTLAQSYTYDLAGNIAMITMPSGRVVTYTRNANGLVSNVAAPINGTGTNLASSITYLPFGPLSTLTYGNSLTLSATFDTDYNPTNRTISGGIANWTYTTDKNSNVTQAGATTYGYDALNRVNAENAGAATSYTYDATDNRLTKVQGGTTTTTVPSTSNKISAVGGTSYTYDSAGNITAIGANGYVWSAAGLMKEYKISGVSTATYTYNGYNQRTKKVTGGVTTHYVYGAGGLLQGEYTTVGALVREYVYLNGAPLAQVNSGSPETVTYLHTDHIGTPRFGTNAAGTQVWSWNNDAFGVSSPSGSVTVNLRMLGQYYDSESGLFYNWNRYYNPAIGRYISSDPIGIAGGLNPFGYVGQNPVNRLDLFGLQSTLPIPQDPLGTMLDPKGLNLLPPTPAELQQIQATLAIITGGDQSAIMALNPHAYENRPDPTTGAMLPPCSKYVTFDVFPVTSPRSGQRIIIGADQSIWYTNNHYRSFYQVAGVPQIPNPAPPSP